MEYIKLIILSIIASLLLASCGKPALRAGECRGSLGGSEPLCAPTEPQDEAQPETQVNIDIDIELDLKLELEDYVSYVEAESSKRLSRCLEKKLKRFMRRCLKRRKKRCIVKPKYLRKLVHRCLKQKGRV